MVGKYIELSEENFGKTVLSESKPILVDFWATWCPPCRMLAPIIEEIAAEFEGRVVVAKLDVDNAPSISEQYGVMSIPTLILYKNGNVMEKLVGVQAKSKIVAMIEKYI